MLNMNGYYSSHKGLTGYPKAWGSLFDRGLPGQFKDLLELKTIRCI